MIKYFQKISDWAAVAFASVWFQIFHFAWWTLWMTAAVFDPYPFQLLTLIVSLESIMLSGLILNATNRSGDEDRRIIEKDLSLDHQTNAMIREIWEEIKTRPKN